jgi:CDP-glucose 4,6-dehydratase
MGTANLLEIARVNPDVQAVVVVTTDKVYKNDNLGRRFIESDPLLGGDPYSASKVGTENVVIAWRQICANNFGPSISIVRSGNVIGGGDQSKDRLFADIIRARILKDGLRIRNPRSTRPWQHVLDPLNGYLMSMERALNDQVGAVFNFGPTENSLSVAEVIETVERIWPDLAIEYVENSADPYESKLLDLNSSYAREFLNWEPRYSQTEAIELTISWWDRVLKREASPLESTDFDVLEFIEKKKLS